MRHHPKLLSFPIVSGLAGIAFLGIFLGVTFGLAAISPEGGVLAGLLLVYLALTFVSTFFTAALVHQTRSVLAGGKVSIAAGVAAAWDRKTPILIWSIIAATVGVVINAIENSDSRAARLLGTLFSVAWTLMTFFIVPVIVFERPSTTEMFKRSAGTFKQTYGETPISLLGIQLVSVAIVLPFALVGIYLFTLGVPTIGIGLVLVGVLSSFLVSQTLGGVVKTTLYLYAVEGTQPEEFDDVDFDRLNENGGRMRAPRGTTSGGFS